ncbi:MAG: hypothetical protein CSA75_04520 [Sorangium cellulosum]|nr:MAG: hypothetical protein CSA75_04520 [Sorangium cellulosum]
MTAVSLGTTLKNDRYASQVSGQPIPKLRDVGGLGPGVVRFQFPPTGTPRLEPDNAVAIQVDG